MLVETNFFNQRFTQRHVDMFQSIIEIKEQRAKDFSQEIFNTEKISFESCQDLYLDNKRLLTNQEMSFFVFKNSDLLYWSDNSISFPYSKIQDIQNSRLVFVDHAWYFATLIKQKEYTAVVLSCIKKEYAFQNKFIRNEFHSDFNINHTIKISPIQSDKNYSIYSSDGTFLLGLSKNHGRADNILQRYFSIFLYFIGIVFLLVFMHHFLLKIRKRYIRDFANLIFLGLLILIRYWMLAERAPFVCYTTDLFDSNFFASSDFIPSLGDLLIDVILLLYFVYQIQTRIRDWRPSTKFKNALFLTLFPIISVALFTVVSSTYESLVYNSIINFELHKLLQTTFLTIMSLTIIGLLQFMYFLLLFSSYTVLAPILNKLKGVYVLAVVTLTSLACIQFGFVHNIFLFILFQLSIHGLFLYKQSRKGLELTKAFKFVILLLVAVFSQFYLYDHIQKKHTKVKEVYAINKSNEQDPVAELLLKDVKHKMMKDTVLAQMLHSPINKDDKVNRYLQKKYFDGFLTRYDLKSTICGTIDGFSDENKLANCELYFTDVLNQYGVKLPYSDYYFLNNQNGSISYFDAIEYTWKNGAKTKLYIELNSKRILQELGYPELLLDGDVQNKEIESYSYAKYLDNRIVNQKGTYSYSLELPVKTTLDYYTFSDKRYKHLLYKVNNRTSIIVSHKVPSVFEHMVSFSYMFIYFLLLLMVYELSRARSFKHLFSRQTFTQKIRYSLFSMLFASLILTGVSLVLLNTRQYTKAQEKTVKEKMQSILIELNHTFEELDLIPEDMIEYIEGSLIRISNTYFTDVNLYDKNGHLLASSRPEIFNYKLTGTQLNSAAFNALNRKQLTEYVHKESIGNLSYTSAYTVLTNSQNKTLGYLNLPYFTKQAELTQQITSQVVAILNIFVILIMISTVLAVVLSNKITYPLQILRDKLKQVKVGNVNEKITWKTNDEIGDLIENYNSMIDQLESSANKLAESEREGAWHEMARQIAHEIKNPLTPIKLNIQLLNKSWERNDPEFSTRLKNVSKTIIEQIETLSETASSFSNFAKIQEGNPEKIELIALLRNCILLFGQEAHVNIDSTLQSKEVQIFADKEKIVRLFNNLLKNAIQSISKETTGNITVLQTIEDNNVVVQITDSGCGISDEIKEKLFEPKFTTKSTGSGLGLAICKKIIEQSNGEIWFESAIGKGTSFYVKLPLSNM